jgi:predicted nucleic acid-binding protein
VDETWVVNASPIITLGWIERLDLLAEGEQKLVLPDAVVTEVLAGPPSDHARVALERGWGPNRVAVAATNDVLEWGLGPGESAVITLARRERATAILDDAEARACARTLGVPVMGTLGVVPASEEEGADRVGRHRRDGSPRGRVLVGSRGCPGGAAQSGRRGVERLRASTLSGSTLKWIAGTG